MTPIRIIQMIASSTDNTRVVVIAKSASCAVSCSSPFK